MTAYKRGDVVLISFVYSDESGAKNRPVVIVSSDAYNQHRQETVVAAITSNTDRVLIGDHLISSWKEAGLLSPSLATGIVRTIKKDMIVQKLGTMPADDLGEIDRKLRISLSLP